MTWRNTNGEAASEVARLTSSADQRLEEDLSALRHLLSAFGPVYARVYVDVSANTARVKDAWIKWEHNQIDARHDIRALSRLRSSSPAKSDPQLVILSGVLQNVGGGATLNYEPKRGYQLHTPNKLSNRVQRVIPLGFIDTTGVNDA